MLSGRKKILENVIIFTNSGNGSVKGYRRTDDILLQNNEIRESQCQAEIHNM